MAQPDEATLPITRVTLYTSGVGYFERGGEVEGDAPPDPAASPSARSTTSSSRWSCWTRGGGADLQPVTYAAQDPVQPSLAGVLGGHQRQPGPGGAAEPDPGHVRDGGRRATGEALTGVIVGRGRPERVLHEATGRPTQFTLNLLADDGLHSVSLLRRAPSQDQ